MITRIATALILLPLAAASQSALTPTELHCAAVGVLAHAITVDRNAGVPLPSTLDTVRRGILPWWTIPQAQADALAWAIYADTAHLVTPNEARQAAEVGCLTPDRPAVPVTPTRRGKRS